MNYVRALAAILVLVSTTSTAWGSSDWFRQPDASAAPAVQFGASDLTLRGIVPGGKVVLFAIGLLPNGYDSAVERWATVLSDDDRDGEIHFDAGQEVPWKSIWVDVELPSLKYRTSAPAGYGIHAKSRATRRLQRGESSHVDQLVFAGSFLDALYVAPGGDCWVIEARDGYDTDADGTVDGFITASLSRFRPLTGKQPPSEFSPGGILFIINFARMELITVPVNAELLNGAQ